jgi:hypothetical protein
MDASLLHGAIVSLATPLRATSSGDALCTARDLTTPWSAEAVIQMAKGSRFRGGSV